MGRATVGLRQCRDDKLGKCRSEDIERYPDVRGIFKTALGTAQTAGESGLVPAPAEEAQNLSTGTFGAAQQTFCAREQNAVPNVIGPRLSYTLSNVVDTRLTDSSEQSRSETCGAHLRVGTQTPAVRGDN